VTVASEPLRHGLQVGFGTTYKWRVACVGVQDAH